MFMVIGKIKEENDFHGPFSEMNELWFGVRKPHNYCFSSIRLLIWKLEYLYGNDNSLGLYVSKRSEMKLHDFAYGIM